MIFKLIISFFLIFSLNICVSNNVFANDLQQQANEIQQLINNKKYDEAKQKLDNLLYKNDNGTNTNSKNPKLLFLQGLLFTETNNIEAAIKVFTEITQFYPELPEPYNNLAVLYAQQNQLEQAKNALEMAIQTHPNYAIAYENLGDIYIRLANQAYSKAKNLNNTNSVNTKLLELQNLLNK